jgi:hypothetical protein
VSASEDFTKDETASEAASLKADFVEKLPWTIALHRTFFCPVWPWENKVSTRLSTYFFPRDLNLCIIKLSLQCFAPC